jgi:eukaryotic-like serine/threonine-protein kinase
VKILDFGLAKLTQPDGNQSQTEIPTRRVDTNPGVIMGTVGYMSPEQVKGRQVDQRSDIFAFGAILYEMLSGRRAFHGESPAETMSAILKEDPPELFQTNQNVSPALERLVNRCLEKSPESRFHSASDLAFALDALSGSASSFDKTISVATPGLQSRTRERFIWITAVTVPLIIAIALAFSNFRRAANASQTMRFFITPTDQTAFISALVSPDGHLLVIRGRDSSGKTFLLIRSLDSLSTQSLSGTDDATFPFWSPDSRSIAFFAGGKLKRIDVNGGPPQTLCDTDTGPGPTGAWNRDGVIVFARDDALYRVSAAGGIATALTALDQAHGEISHKYPQFLPDGKHFLYLAQNAKTEDSSIYVRALDSSENRLILKTRAQAAYVPDGYLLFVRDRTLMAQPFDASKLQLTGEPIRVAEEVGVDIIRGFANFSVSDNGMLTYMSGGTDGQMFLFDRDGKSLGALGPTGNYSNVYLSPDEKRVAASITDLQSGARDVWLLDIARNAPTRFTFDPAEDSIPIWSPDGSLIAFVSDREGTGNLYVKSANSAGKEELLLKTTERKFLHDWSRDGKFIAYSSLNTSTNIDLWALPMTGDKKPFPLLQSPFVEDHARFSPDGYFIAYSSNETGRYEVYVQTFPPSGGKWVISRDGGAQPRWRRDGKEIFFIAPDRKLMAADVKLAGSNFEVSVPKPLFQTQIAGPIPRNRYDVFGNGQRFLIITPRQENNLTPITVVANWTAGLQR